MKIYDISREVFSCAVYPGDSGPEKAIVSSTMEKPWIRQIRATSSGIFTKSEIKGRKIDSYKGCDRMIKQPVTDRAADQQKKIEGSLMQLTTSSSYANISVSDICRHAQIPRRTLYYYYDSKDAVLESVMAQLMDMCDLETMFSYNRKGESLEYSLCCFYEYWGNRRKNELTAFITSELEQRLMLFNGKELVLGENDELPELTGAAAEGKVEVAPSGCTFIVL